MTSDVKIPLAVGFAALLVTAYLTMRTEESPPRPSANSSPKSEPIPQIPKVAVSPDRGAKAPPRVPAPRPTKTLYIEFAASQDLAGYYRAKANASPSPDEKFYMAEAMKRCVDWIEPNRTMLAEHFPEKFNVDALPDGPRKRALRAERDQCSGFDRMNLDFRKAPDALRSEALAGGSPAAIAASLTDLRDKDPSQAAEHALAILQSNDAFAIASLWSYLVKDGAPSRFGFSEMNLAAMQDAWFATACEYGLDCGPGSRTQRDLCVNLNYCENNSYDEFLRNRRYSSDDYARLSTYRDFFKEVLHNHDWPRLGIPIPKKP